ncbi:uncharacterized protein LOC143045312 isoform X2 [Mytilus galloprovincialis]|uniref:uncharacterized protein LOC143045312 isoform X2 n=1 Tax=Mytilus galloprovincialis TaxID=29158 RepID=UPI003F7CCA41
MLQFMNQIHVFIGLEDPYILCEGLNNTFIECPAAKVIKIEAAIYGRTDKSVCQHTAIESTSCKKTVTSIVQKKCNFNQTCLPISSNIYGDPCTDERLSSKPSTHLTTPIFTASPRSSPTTEQQEIFSTTDAQSSLKSTTYLPTQFFTPSPSSSSKTEQQVSFSKTGLAVGISVTIAVIIVISCMLIILRKRKSSSKKQSTQSSTNDKDYIGTQNVAMPRSGDSPEYNDLKVRRETHKYGELQYISKPKDGTCYDYIDANEHARGTKVSSVEQGICQEYSMLDPSEKWNTESNTSSYHHAACNDYTVLETEKAITNHVAYPPSVHLKYKNNEVKSANNAKRDNYIVLDPKVTGFNRMNDTGNDKFDPNPRDMVHDTTHPVKENTNCYELAKPVLKDGKEKTCHKYDGDYGSCQDSDYQLNAGHPTYSEEHVYNHTVDDVYDSTSHNKKSAVPDNTYDYFSGNQTDDDYNIPMKM